MTHPPHGSDMVREGHEGRWWAWGATHRSRAAGVKPSWPFPAMPLLEHAASGHELLGGGRTGGTLHVRPDAPNRTESNKCAALYSREWTAKRPSGSEPGPKPRLPPPTSPRPPKNPVCTGTSCYGLNCSPRLLCGSPNPSVTAFREGADEKRIGMKGGLRVGP